MDRLIPIEQRGHDFYCAGMHQGYANGLADAVRNLRASAAHYGHRDEGSPTLPEALLALAAQLEAAIHPAELEGQRLVASALWSPPVTPAAAVLESRHAEPPPAAAPPGA